MGNSHSITSNHKGDCEKISKKILAHAPVDEIIQLIIHETGDHGRLVSGYVNQEKYAEIHPLHVAVKCGAPMELINYLTQKGSRFCPIVASKRTKEINEHDTLDWLTSRPDPQERDAELLKLLLHRIPIEVTMHYYSQLFINLLTCPVEITTYSNRRIEVFFNHVHCNMVHHPKALPGPTSSFYIPFEFDFLQYPNQRYFVGFQFVTPYQYVCDPHFNRTDTPELRKLISILHRNWMGWNPLYHVFIEGLIQAHFTPSHHSKRFWTTGIGTLASAAFRVTGVFHHWFLAPQPIAPVQIEHNSYTTEVYLPEIVEHAMVTNWDLESRPIEVKQGTVENIEYSLSKFFPRETFHQHSDLIHGVVRSDGSIRSVPYSLFGPDLPAGILFNNNRLFNSQLFNWILEDLATLHYEQYNNGTYIYYPWQSIASQWAAGRPKRDYSQPLWSRYPLKHPELTKHLPSIIFPTDTPHLTQLNADDKYPYTLHIANPHTSDIDWTSIYYQHCEETDKKVDEESARQSRYWVRPLDRNCYFLHDETPPHAFGQYILETCLYSRHPRPPNPPGPGESVPEGVKLLKFSDFQEEIRQVFIALIPSPVSPQTSLFFRDLYKTPIHIRNSQLQLLENEPFHYTKTLPQRWSSPYYLDLTKVLRFLTLFKQNQGYPNSAPELLTSMKSYLSTVMKGGVLTPSRSDNFLLNQNTWSSLPKQQYTTYSLRYISRALYLLQHPNIPLYADSQLATNAPRSPKPGYHNTLKGYYKTPDPIRSVAFFDVMQTDVKNWEYCWPSACLPIELPFFKDENDAKDPDYALFGTLHRLFPFTTQPAIPLVSIMTQLCNNPNLLLTSMKTIGFIEEFYTKMVSATTQSSTEMNLSAYEDPANMIGANGKYSIPILAYMTRADFAVTTQYLLHGIGHNIHLSDAQISKWNNDAYNLTVNAIQGDYPRGTKSNYGMEVNPTMSGIGKTSNQLYSQEPPQMPPTTLPLPLIYNPSQIARLSLLPQSIPMQLSMERTLLNSKFPMTKSAFVHDPWDPSYTAVTPARSHAGAGFWDRPTLSSARKWAAAHLSTKSLQDQSRYDPIVYQPATLPVLMSLHPSSNRNPNYFNEELLRFPPLMARLWSGFDSSAAFFSLSILQELNFQLSLGRKIPTFRPELYCNELRNSNDQVVEVSAMLLRDESPLAALLSANYDPMNIFATQAMVGGVGSPYEGNALFGDTALITETKAEKSKSKSKSTTATTAAGPSSEEILRKALQSNNPLSTFDPRISTEWLDRIGIGYKVLALSKLLMKSGMATTYTLTKALPTMGHLNHIGDYSTSPTEQALSRRQNMLPVVDNHGLVAHCNPYGQPYYPTFLLYKIDYNSCLQDPEVTLNIPRVQPNTADHIFVVNDHYAAWWNTEHEVYPISVQARLDAVEKVNPTKLAQPEPMPISNLSSELILYFQSKPLGIFMKAFIQSLHLFPSIDAIMQKGGALSGLDYNDIESFTQWSHLPNMYGFDTAPKQQPGADQYNPGNTPQSRVTSLATPTSRVTSLGPQSPNTPSSSTTTLQLPSFDLQSLPTDDDVLSPRNQVGGVSLSGIEANYTIQNDDDDDGSGVQQTSYGTCIPPPSDPVKHKLPLIEAPPLDFILSSFHDQFTFLMSTGSFWVNFQSPFFPMWNQMEVLTLPMISKQTALAGLVSNSFLYDDLLTAHQHRIMNSYHYLSELFFTYHSKIQNLLDLPKLVMAAPAIAPKNADVDYTDLVVTLPKHIAASRVLPPPQTLPESLLRTMHGYFFQAPRLPHNSFSSNLVSALFDIAEAFIIKHTMKQEDTHEYFRVVTCAHQAASRPPMPVPIGMNRKHAKLYKVALAGAPEIKKDAASANTSDSDSGSGSDEESDDDTAVTGSLASALAAAIAPGTPKSPKSPKTPKSTTRTLNSDDGDEDGIAAPSEYHTNRPFNNDEIPILTTADYAEYYITFLLFQPFAFDNSVMVASERQVQSVSRIANKQGQKRLGFVPKMDPTFMYSAEHLDDSGRPKQDKDAKNLVGAECARYNHHAHKKLEADEYLNKEDVLIASNYHFLYNLFNSNEIERLEYRTQFHNLSFDQFLVRLAEVQARTSSEIRLSIHQSEQAELATVNQAAQKCLDANPDMSYDDALVQVDTTLIQSLVGKQTGYDKLPVRATHFPNIRDCINVIDTYITTVVYKLFPHLAAFPQFALPQKGLLWFLDLIYQPSLDDILPLINGLSVDHTELPPTAATLFTTSCNGIPFAYDYPTVDIPIHLKPFEVMSVSQIDEINQQHDGNDDKFSNPDVVLMDPILSIFEPVDMLFTSSLVLHPQIVAAPRSDIPQPDLPQSITYGQTFFIQSILRRQSPTILNALINTITMDSILIYRNHHMLTPFVQDKVANKFSVFDFMEIARTFTYAPAIYQKIERAAKEFYS